ncbi:TVG1267989 [Thermoplasma volcanium GSS1]|uniref:TVG1267989 protein n=1 Tax=Thermoplasma volcanium (strain ATCC 51530 / DSM 4299 / JCM 9571 / NBRC 15438 / GSS1) TaxID=273116 RepID=Q979D1_THEVO|nr:TVG1267989 [Thermoplasma volcanium GSS1]
MTYILYCAVMKQKFDKFYKLDIDFVKIRCIHGKNAYKKKRKIWFQKGLWGGAKLGPI